MAERGIPVAGRSAARTTLESRRPQATQRQMVVLAALRQRTKGWKPAGPFSLGRWGVVVNVAALVYGVFAMVLLALPGASGDAFADWVVLIGLGVVLATGLAYLLLARPDRRSDAPAGDAVEVAERLRAHGSRAVEPEGTTVG